MISKATGTTEVGDHFRDLEPAQGILRLYRDAHDITTGKIERVTTSCNASTTANTTASASTTEQTAPTKVKTVEATGEDNTGTSVIYPDQDTTVCVLAVPTYMSPGDFLNFVGPVRQDASHFRIIRFMVLIKFRSADSTAAFYKRYNGRPFSSLEPEICHVVYLKSIEIRAGGVPPYAFPFLHADPFMHSSSSQSQQQQQQQSPLKSPPPAGPNKVSSSVNLGGSASSSGNLSSPAPERSEAGLDVQEKAEAENDLDPTSQGLAELPTCPVCLERMDSSVTGLLTILCQHTFHCHCLSKWGEGSCPVCRYSQKSIKRHLNRHQRNSQQPHSSSTTDGLLDGSPIEDLDEESQNQCSTCGTTENLWICLICGHIGCGRYQEKHAYHHYYHTHHLYALELETQRVWDYAGDGYVHRLIQNKTDGKLVELPGAVDEGPHPLSSEHSVQIGQEKLDAIGLEYTHLLTTQLESQRMYFDAQMAAMTQQLNAKLAECKERERALEQLRAENAALKSTQDELEKVRIPSLMKDKKQAEKKLERMQERLSILERQYEEEKEMNAGLQANTQRFKDKLAANEAEIEELREQVRDMMIYLSTQQKVEASPLKDELVNGTVGVVPISASSSSPRNSNARRKRK
ncbi:hypothetical protein BGW42_003969 [Actinomortierella wolfii]|nr:hypothetical protein BGW42_003969 [Actinomortierella wolfii]